MRSRRPPPRREHIRWAASSASSARTAACRCGHITPRRIHLTLDRAIANTVRFSGLPIDDVIPMASTIPATYLGMTTVGAISADWDPCSGDLQIREISG